MSRYWSKTVSKLEPYVPGEQPGDRKYIKLNTNENPYPPSPNVIKAIHMAADERLKLYPNPTSGSLREVISQHYGLKKDQVFVGNGSDEVLAFAFMAFFNPGDTILFPDITYSFYEVYAALFGVGYKTIPLDTEFNIPVERFFEECNGVILANPNAPTGKAISVQAVESILEHSIDRVVIIDEAYVDFGGESSIRLVNRYPNLLVTQTFSKSRSLAGLRVGFALGQEELIEALNRIKDSVNSYTVDRLAMAGAEEAWKDEAYFKENISKVINIRDKISKKLRGLGFYVIDSKTNFIFISHPEVHAALLFQKLREEGILVRHFNKPRIDNFLRVSIGSDSEMDSFHDAIKRLV